MTARKVAWASLWLLCALTLNVTAEAATVTVAWDRNPEPDVQGYVVSYGTASQSYTIEVNAGNQTAYTFNLSPSTPTRYYFVVQAYNANGRSAYSAEVNTTVVDSTSAVLTIDRPLQGSVMPPDMLLSGWALDRASTSGSGIDAVHVYAYPTSGAPSTFLGVASYGAARADVASAYGPQFVNSGYSLPIASLPPGTYDLAFYAHSTVSNAFNIVRNRRVTVHAPNAAPPPSGTVVTMDMPTSFSTVNRWLSVGGWAIDMRATTGTGVDLVQVLAYPNPGSGQQPLMLGNAQYGRARDDVATAFRNSRFRPSGFHFDVMGMQPGAYDIVTLARNTVNGAVDTARVKRVTIDPATLITVDGPATNSTVRSSFAITGWTLDRRATSGTGVDVLHVWAFPTSGAAPIFLAEARSGQPRPDVATIYGSRYRASGFSIPITLAPGTYDVVVYPHSSVAQAFENLRVLRLTVR
jgi:hypothetical protein